jgi:uncharacterized caspase-like protein
VALDGDGANSPYSQALAVAIETETAPLEELFRDVRVKVMAATEEKQVPWDSSSLTGAFYFQSKIPRTEVQPAPQVAAVTPPAAPSENESVTRGQAEVPPTAPGQVFGGRAS